MNFTGMIISFLGSLGLFLFGMAILSSALQKTAGGKMKQLLGQMSETRFRGVLFGAGVTTIIQSSTATTVMAVGFVNAGIISLTQIVGIIMGANIGTTTTSWLISSYEWANFLRPNVLGAFCAAGGALIVLFSKKDKLKHIGEAIAGFGLLFIGLSQMPSAVKPLAELDAVRNLFIIFGNNPILALLAGILVTATIQSSTASIGILQSMAVTGMIPWSAAVFIVLGQNVGTCFTTMFTAIGACKNTRAAAFVHFVYNAIGAVIFSLAAFVFFSFINPAFGSVAASSTNISKIHTGYNVLLLLILFPLGAVIQRVAVMMAGEDKVVAEDKCELTKLDENILETPEYALENSENAVHKLTDMLRTNIVLASDIFSDNKFDEIDGFNVLAAETDKANATIRSFLIKLYTEKLNEAENASISNLLHNLTSLERISSHTKGIVKQAEELRDGKLEYSKETAAKLREISEKKMLVFDDAIRALTLKEPKHVVLALQGADEIEAMREGFKAEYLERAAKEKHITQNGNVFMEALRHMSSIASHSKNIAEAVPVEDR